jgi:hypothetical protein
MAITYVGRGLSSWEQSRLPEGWQVGDLAIAFSSRQIELTGMQSHIVPPSRPNGWTNIRSVNGSGSDPLISMAWRMCYRVLQEDDSAPTFQNAGFTQIVAVRGYEPSQPIGQSSSGDRYSESVSNRLRYASMALLASDSWVLGFGRASTITTIYTAEATSMTRRSEDGSDAAGTPPHSTWEQQCFHTEHDISGTFPQRSTDIISGLSTSGYGWRTGAVEIIAAPEPPLVSEVEGTIELGGSIDYPPLSIGGILDAQVTVPAEGT